MAVGVVGNAAAGKQKAAACTACHGQDGNKTLDGTYPRLAGQHPDYLVKALREYRNGKRKNLVMQGQAQNLKDSDIDDIAAYFGSLDGELHDLSKHGH
jgi:cytochrome c553